MRATAILFDSAHKTIGGRGEQIRWAKKAYILFLAHNRDEM